MQSSHFEISYVLIYSLTKLAFSQGCIVLRFPTSAAGETMLVHNFYQKPFKRSDKPALTSCTKHKAPQYFHFTWRNKARFPQGGQRSDSAECAAEPSPSSWRLASHFTAAKRETQEQQMTPDQQKKRLFSVTVFIKRKHIFHCWVRWPSAH